MACELCGYELVTVVHHKDRNPLNNSPDNLQILCMNCHFLQHHQKGSDGSSKKERLIASFKITLRKKNIEKVAITIAKKEDLVYSARLAEIACISQQHALKILNGLERAGKLMMRRYGQMKLYHLPNLVEVLHD